VRIEYQHPDRVYELVQRDQADVGLVSYPQADRATMAIPWRDEPMVLVCAPCNELAGLELLNLSQLHGCSVVSFAAGLRIRREIDRALATAGAEVQVVMEFDNTETIKRAIEIDAGVGLLPAPTVEREVASGSLIVVPLAESLVRPLGIIQRRGKEPTPTTRQFVDFLLQMAKPPIEPAAATADRFSTSGVD
jgi:DNA-binding transcriptional LysR family regulator